MENKVTDADNFAKELGELLDNGISDILSQPIDAECPDCGNPFDAVPLVTDRCPHCGSPVRWE